MSLLVVLGGSCCLLVAVVLVVLGLYVLADSLLRKPKLTGPNSDRFVLITGCDSGFGFEAARRFDALGCHVIAACLRKDGETELRRCCSDRLQTVPMNVSDHQSVTRAFKVVCRILPPGKGLWGLVNNAGVGAPSIGPCEWLTIADYRTCMDVNFLGVVAVTSTFLPLVKRERGRIVNVSSLLGRAALSLTSAPYVTSKFALEGYSDVLRRTMTWYGVGVHIIEPSAHPTRLFLDNEPGIRNAWRQTTDDVRKTFGADYLQTLIDYYEKSSHTDNKIASVVDAYEHAVLGRFPRARYLVGSGCRTALLVESLPEWLSDRLLRRQLRFPPPALRP